MIPCTNFFSSSLKSYITDFGYSFLLFSDKMFIAVTFGPRTVLQCTKLQAGRSRDRVPMRWIFLIYLILPAALGPGVDSASNRNEYQESFLKKKKKKKKPGGKVRPARRADNLAAIY
jgi:hypothetical protein